MQSLSLVRFERGGVVVIRALPTQSSCRSIRTRSLSDVSPPPFGWCCFSPLFCWVVLLGLPLLLRGAVFPPLSFSVVLLLYLLMGSGAFSPSLPPHRWRFLSSSPGGGGWPPVSPSVVVRRPPSSVGRVLTSCLPSLSGVVHPPFPLVEDLFSFIRRSFLVILRFSLFLLKCIVIVLFFFEKEKNGLTMFTKTKNIKTHIPQSLQKRKKKLNIFHSFTKFLNFKRALLVFFVTKFVDPLKT